MKQAHFIIVPKSRSALIEKLRPLNCITSIDDKESDKFIIYKLKLKDEPAGHAGWRYGQIFLNFPPIAEGAPELPLTDEQVCSKMEEILRMHNVS